LKNILISRTDNIGDVILTLPMAGRIKELYPEAKISFLGKSYTKPVIDLCQHISHFHNYNDIENWSEREQVEFFKSLQFDSIIHVYPNQKVAKIAHKAKIPQRIGTSHRMYHYLYCNERISFSRKNSQLHEAQLNFKLLAPITQDDFIPLIGELPKYYGMNAGPSDYPLNPNKINLVFHTKSFGSAMDWPMQRYIELCELLDQEKYHIYFTGTSKESALISPHIQELIKNGRATDLTGQFSLEQYIQFINTCDGLVACSTGPLHIAACLGKNALGFYSSHRPIHAGRWSPIGNRAQFIEACDQKSKKPDITIIDAAMALEFISKWRK
jgi:heptosyltransferase-3